MPLILTVILILLAALVAWSLFKPPAPPARNLRGSDYEPMVRCQHCGVNLPRSQATPDSDGAWRCPAHRHEND